MLNWSRSNGLVRYRLALIIVFTLSSAIGCARGPGMQLMLKPNDLGPGWVYKMKLGSRTFGGWTLQSQYGGKVVDMDDNTKLIKGVFQLVRVYPDVETAIEDEDLKELRTHLEPLDLPFWDEVYLKTDSDKKHERITLRKANQIIFLSYCEEIWWRSPLTGEFNDVEYPELNQEQIQWTDNFLCDLAEVIQRKIVAR